MARRWWERLFGGRQVAARRDFEDLPTLGECVKADSIYEWDKETIARIVELRGVVEVLPRHEGPDVWVELVGLAEMIERKSAALP